MGNRMEKLELSEDERLLVDLHRVSLHSPDASVRETAQSLKLWFHRRGEWTPKQKALVGQLCNAIRRVSPTVRARLRGRQYTLYAIRLGDELKVGITLDVSKRLKSYVTGSSVVELLAQHTLSPCPPGYAKGQEKLLHRYLRKRGHWIVRELFHLDALDDFKSFKPKVKAKHRRMFERLGYGALDTKQTST